jgi:hypothetical protein
MITSIPTTSPTPVIIGTFGVYDAENADDHGSGRERGGGGGAGGRWS